MDNVRVSEPFSMSEYKIVIEEKLQDLPPEVIKNHQLAIMEARMLGKEDGISDNDGEITGSGANTVQIEVTG